MLSWRVGRIQIAWPNPLFQVWISGGSLAVLVFGLAEGFADDGVRDTPGSIVFFSTMFALIGWPSLRGLLARVTVGDDEVKLAGMVVNRRVDRADVASVRAVCIVPNHGHVELVLGNGRSIHSPWALNGSDRQVLKLGQWLSEVLGVPLTHDSSDGAH
jgi:hypothetical protein